MLEISWSELLILAVVTLVFVGPKELPVFLRTIGRYAGMARRQANEFKSHFDAAMREAELAQMQEEMEKMQAAVNAEVMGAQKVLKDTTALTGTSVAQASSFTAAAQAAVFPTPTAQPAAQAAPVSAPAVDPAMPAAPVPAPLGQVYVRPQPPPAAEPARETPAEPSIAEGAPPRPEVVKSEA